jgi:hypothetical protein
LASFGDALSIVSNVGAFASFLFGGGPPVVLGDVTFQELETPEKIPFGGKQMLVVHKLPGGARVIDAMGRDDLDLAWSGILEGPLASYRALEIDNYRTTGVPIVLSWGIYSYTVVVHSFIANYSKSNWIPYELSCIVVQDNAAGAPPAPSIPQQILADVQSAVNVATSLPGQILGAL